MNFDIPLCKIDEERRLVIGRAVQEVVDRSGEILDYESAKPAFLEWSNSFVEATGGLSKGNVRVMHDSKRVAGKLVDLSFNDQDKAIDIVAKIVDDQEWKKVVEGVYTGFSVGGAYARKWTDESGQNRYTPRVSEITLVDRPCIQTCRIIELHKADGSIMERRIDVLPGPLTRAAPRTYAAMAAAAPRTYAQMRSRA